MGNTPDIPVPHQPLLVCEFPGGVQLSALLDTGSMRSILSADVYQHIADNCSCQGQTLAPVRVISSSPCISVTGHPLHFSGLMETQFPLPGCDYRYTAEVMICDTFDAALTMHFRMGFYCCT